MYRSAALLSSKESVHGNEYLPEIPIDIFPEIKTHKLSIEEGII